MTMITKGKDQEITLVIPERKPEVEIIHLDKNSPMKIKVQSLGHRKEEGEKR